MRFTRSTFRSRLAPMRQARRCGIVASNRRRVKASFPKHLPPKQTFRKQPIPADLAAAGEGPLGVASRYSNRPATLPGRIAHLAMRPPPDDTSNAGSRGVPRTVAADNVDHHAAPKAAHQVAPRLGSAGQHQHPLAKGGFVHPGVVAIIALVDIFCCIKLI
jgi:hypothetical protein